MPTPELTEREYAILRGFAAGRTRAQLGRELHRSPSTVDTSVRRLFDKLGARTEAHAVDIGHRRGLLGDPPQVAAEPAPPRMPARRWDPPDAIRRRRHELDEALRGYQPKKGRAA